MARDSELDLDRTADLERQLAEAQKKLDAVWKVRTDMQKHRTVPTTRTVQVVLDPYILALARILKGE